MNEITTNGGALSVLTDYAERGRYCLKSAAMNLLEFGRILCEAKELLPHGEFGKWYEREFNMKRASAAQYMGIYKRYGSNDAVNTLSFSVMREMMKLPQGSEDDFVAEYEPDGMSASQAREAVREFTQKMSGTAEPEPVKETPAAEDDPLLKELARLRQENEVLTQQKTDLWNQYQGAEKRSRALEHEAEENAEYLETLQKELQKQKDELLNSQSQAIRGDAERIISDTLSAKEFSQLVHAFLGNVSIVGAMGDSFVGMNRDEKRIFRENLDSVALWVENARKAMSVEVVAYV